MLISQTFSMIHQVSRSIATVRTDHRNHLETYFFYQTKKTFALRSIKFLCQNDENSKLKAGIARMAILYNYSMSNTHYSSSPPPPLRNRHILPETISSSGMINSGETIINDVKIKYGLESPTKIAHNAQS